MSKKDKEPATPPVTVGRLAVVKWWSVTAIIFVSMLHVAVRPLFSIAPLATCSQRLWCARIASVATMASLSVDLQGKTVPILPAPGLSEDVVRKAIASSPFQQWLEHMRGPRGILSLGGAGGARCSLREILVQSVDMFGDRVGFVKFKAEVVDEASGAKLPGIVFARGGAVGILVLLTCQSDTWAVLTEQARVPVGRAILELPAGMLDEDTGDFVGTAAREVEEETGINIRVDDLFDLTSLLEESTGRKMFPSPGGSDEDITLFLYRGTCHQEMVDQLRGSEKGLRDHGELIRVRLVPLKDLWRSSADCKVLAAVALYENAKKNGLLPNPPNIPPSLAATM